MEDKYVKEGRKLKKSELKDIIKEAVQEELNEASDFEGWNTTPEEVAESLINAVMEGLEGDGFIVADFQVYNPHVDDKKLKKAITLVEKTLNGLKPKLTKIFN